MQWTVIETLSVNLENNEETRGVQAGWSYRGKVDGWSIGMEITEASSTCVEGIMFFPERAAFEFDGNFKEMLKTMKKIQGGRGLFASDKFVFWRL